MSFDLATGVSLTNNAQSIGWQFDVLSPVFVTGLGWYDGGPGGLSVAHTIGIWDPSGTLLTSILVPAGDATAFDGQFRTMPVSPFVLLAGTGYIVGGENFPTNTDRLAAEVTQTVDSRITYIGATYSPLNAGFTRPTLSSTATTGFYGPSFSVIPVPEPTGFALLCIGSCLFVVRRRKTRRTKALQRTA